MRRWIPAFLSLLVVGAEIAWWVVLNAMMHDVLREGSPLLELTPHRVLALGLVGVAAFWLAPLAPEWRGWRFWRLYQAIGGTIAVSLPAAQAFAPESTGLWVLGVLLVWWSESTARSDGEAVFRTHSAHCAIGWSAFVWSAIQEIRRFGWQADLLWGFLPAALFLLLIPLHRYLPKRVQTKKEKDS